MVDVWLQDLILPRKVDYGLFETLDFSQRCKDGGHLCAIAYAVFRSHIHLSIRRSGLQDFCLRICVRKGHHLVLWAETIGGVRPVCGFTCPGIALRSAHNFRYNQRHFCSICPHTTPHFIHHLTLTLITSPSHETKRRTTRDAWHYATIFHPCIIFSLNRPFSGIGHILLETQVRPVVGNAQ